MEPEPSQNRNPEPETRNSEPETRNPEPGARGPAQPETRMVQEDVKEPLVAEGYAQLIKALGNPALRDGDFHRCAV